MPPPESPEEQGNTAQIAYWNDKAGVTWTAFQERLDALFEPITALAISAAAPAPGERVIDIGCGCGATVLALADRVGPTGHLLGLDVSEPMSARARQRIEAASLTNATVVVSDAATHTFTEPSATCCSPASGSCSSLIRSPPSPTCARRCDQAAVCCVSPGVR